MLGRIAAAGLAVACLLGVAGCGEEETRPQAEQAVVRLGALLPMTGWSSPSGTGMKAAASLAVDEANRAGGVLGRKVELIVADDACDPGTAVYAANALVTQGITVSVGGYCSTATVPALKIFRSAGVPMVIPSSNSTDLLAPGYDSVFLMSGTTTAEAAFALRWTRRLGATRLAVVEDGTTYSSTMARATTKQAGDVSIVGHLTLSQGAPSYRRIARQVMDQHATAVYFTGYYAEATQLIKDLRAVGYPGIIMLADGCIDGDLLDKLTPAQSEGVYGTALLVPGLMPEVEAWAARFRAAVGNDPGPNTMQAYDAVRVALDAIRRAGTLDREAVRAAIAATADLAGVTGPVRFEADGTRTDARFLLLKAHAGQFTLVA